MLSLVLAALLGGLLLLALAIGTAEGSPLDEAIPAVFWTWLVMTPVLAVAGVVLSGRAHLTGALRLSAIALIIWALILGVALFLH